MWWWTTGPAASYYSRSASREPARRWRSPGTWLTRRWSRKWNGMLCRGDRAAEPRGTSPCCRRSVAPHKRARRWSWRWPGSWCCYGAVPRSWRLWVLCSVSRGTPTGMERPPPCGTPGSAGLPSPEKEMKTHSTFTERKTCFCTRMLTWAAINTQISRWTMLSLRISDFKETLWT